MISIQQEGDKFQVTVQDSAQLEPWRFMANDLRELKLALDHYYGEQHPGSRCPLCRRLRKAIGEDISVTPYRI